MDKEKLISLLQQKDQSVEKTEEPNPYSQKGLEEFVNNFGVNVEQTPRLTELAKSINQDNKLLVTEKPKEEVRNPITTVREKLLKKEEKEPQTNTKDKQLSVEALKKLIAKYKGE